MATLIHLASRYRWELILLVGIPFIERTIWWLLPHILGNFNLSLDYWSCPPDYYCFPRYVSPFLNISLYLLGFFYFHVRRMGRTTLTLLWAFAFVSEVVATAVALPSILIVIERPWELSQWWWAWWVYTGDWWKSWWNMTIPVIPQIMVVVWFARQASRTGFNHALVFIVLAIAVSSTDLGVPIDIFVSFRVGIWDLVIVALTLQLFAVWVLSRLDVPREKHETDVERWIGSWNIPFYGTVLRRLAVRVLPRFDPVRGISRELLVALIGLNWLLQVYVRLKYLIGLDLESAIFYVREAIVFGTIFWSFIVGLAILLAYAVRLRQPPEGPGSIEPRAKPSKPFLCPSYGSEE